MREENGRIQLDKVTRAHELIPQMMEDELKNGYRGYVLLDTRLAFGEEYYRTDMWMANSPLSPIDGMFVVIPLTKEDHTYGKEGIPVMKTLVDSAVEHIKELIDRAYADPDSFTTKTQEGKKPE